MEKRIEELEVALRVAEAKADIAIALVRRLTRNLGHAELISWSDDDLIREHMTTFDVPEPARDFAMLDIAPPNDDERMGQAYTRDIRERQRLVDEIRAQIRHETDQT